MSGDRHPWWLGIASMAASWLIGALGHTWRIERRGMADWERALSDGRRCIIAMWHARIGPVVVTHGHREVAVLISRSKDGEWIARVVERFGYRTARGSSSRGGAAGLLEMIGYAERGHLLGMVVDGPRGPAQRVKDGVVHLASRTGFPVVPLSSATDRAWSFRSWDRLRLPKPFARVVLSYGAPIEVPRDLPDQDVELYRERIEHAMLELEQQVARAAGEPA